MFESNGTCENGNLYDLQPLPEPEIAIPEGVDFQITSESMRKKCLEMQKSGRRFTREGIRDDYCSFDSAWTKYKMMPITITEGVEFSGEAYRAEFERLVEAGREFVGYFRGNWIPHTAGLWFADRTYRLIPQQFPDDDDWHDDMAYAFEELAVVADGTSYSSGTPEGNARQNAAFREVAKMIRAMADRYAKRKRGAK